MKLYDQLSNAVPSKPNRARRKIAAAREVEAAGIVLWP